MNPFAQLALLMVTLLLVVLPFTPMLREWLRPTDNAALPIDQSATHHLRHLADSMRALVTQLLGAAATSQSLRHMGKSLIHKGIRVNIVHDDGQDMQAVGAALQAAGKLAHIVIFSDVAKIVADCNTMADIFALQDMHVGPRAQLRSACAVGFLRLAQYVHIHRWIDAQSISAGSHLVVQGRITAQRSISFSDHSQFVRAGAPVMYFGETSIRHTVAMQEPTPFLATERRLFDCDMTIAEEIVGDLVVSGSAQLAVNAVVYGSIKAHDFLRLQEGVCVAGSLTAGKGIVIGAGCAVLGPLICEDDIIIGPNSIIGSMTIPTSIVCRKLIVAKGVVIHGVITTQLSAFVVFQEIPFGT